MAAAAGDVVAAAADEVVGVPVGGRAQRELSGEGECAIFVVAHPPAPVVPAASGI